MTGKFSNDFSACDDWLALARAIRAVLETDDRLGTQTRAEAVNEIAQTLSRTPTAVWNLLGALHARELLLADLDDAAALKIPQTKFTKARVLLRKHPNKSDAIRAALCDTRVTTRALPAAIQELGYRRGTDMADAFEIRVLAFLVKNPDALDLGEPVRVRRGSWHRQVQPDFLVERGERVVAGIEVKTMVPGSDRTIFGELLLLAHVCETALLIMPAECVDAVAGLAADARELALENVRFAVLHAHPEQLVFC